LQDHAGREEGELALGPAGPVEQEIDVLLRRPASLVAENVLEEDPDDIRELGEVRPGTRLVEWVIGDRAA
jgi:hypothetical protein